MSLPDRVLDHVAASFSVRDAIETAQKALATRGVPEVGLEAAILLGHVLGRSRAWLLTHGDTPLGRSDSGCFWALVERRCRREPSAYLIGEKHWLDLLVTVNRNVLIPRPETELLAEEAISAAKSLAARLERPPVIADIGTGSGALAIALQRGCPTARIYAVDTSPGALRMAKLNALRYGLDTVAVLQGSLLSRLPVCPDLIVANLPYVPTGDIATLEPELAFEPVCALDGGADGLELIREMLRQAHEIVTRDAWLVIECGIGQSRRVATEIGSIWPKSELRIRHDYAGVDRFVIARVWSQNCQTV